MRTAMNKPLKLLLPISGAILLTSVALLIWATTTVEAQGKPTSIKARLEQLQEQVESGQLRIGFQFVVPISEGENYWLFGDPTGDKELTFVEIEDDHFCFSQRREQAVLIRCIPYTNIASFDYLTN